MNKTTLPDLIIDNYDIDVTSISNAPRQFVAKTYFIESKGGDKYFCKVVDKPLFIPNIIASLPALHNIHELGYQKINYPIETISGELHLIRNDTLVVLYNFIDAHQGYDYSEFEFGKTIAEIHNLTEKVSAKIPQESFSFKHDSKFKKGLDQLINLSTKDPTIGNLQQLCEEKKHELLSSYKIFKNIANRCKNKSYELVITHGDAPGNTLVKSAKEIFIIDWDEISLAPAERDLWFLRGKRYVIKGYNSIHASFRLNDDLVRYYILSRYFNDLVEYWEEIQYSDDKVHRDKNFRSMKDELFESTGWLFPEVNYAIKKK